MHPEQDPPAGAGDDVRFEAAMERLEEIVERMESTALELDEALALYEEGVRLLRATQGVLDRSEARIRELLPDGEGFRLDEWEPS
jgi:exodeoxyribonuclease VII small subunit